MDPCLGSLHLCFTLSTFSWWIEESKPGKETSPCFKPLHHFVPNLSALFLWTKYKCLYFNILIESHASFFFHSTTMCYFVLIYQTLWFVAKRWKSSNCIIGFGKHSKEDFSNLIQNNIFCCVMFSPSTSVEIESLIIRMIYLEFMVHTFISQNAFSTKRRSSFTATRELHSCLLALIVHFWENRRGQSTTGGS